MDLIFYVTVSVAWILIIINIIVLLRQKRVSGNLILLEEEAENETYAFMELHEPIDKLKSKRRIRLKIELRSR